MDRMDMKLNLLGKIDEENVRMFIDNLKTVNAIHPDSNSLTIYISSPGGNVDMAVELYHFLRLLDCPIRTVNISRVNSAGIIPFAAGTERFCLQNSSFYLHSITKKLDGSFTAYDLLREAKEMAANTDKVADILAQACVKNKSFWKRLMRKGYLLTSQKANEYGLANVLSECEAKI